MMERLTFEGNFCDIAMCAETPGGSFCESGMCSQRKVWERLKHYEDMEEQGRLVVLPCKVGDTVWRLAPRCFQCEHMDDLEFDCCGEMDFCGTKIAKEVAFKLTDVDELGKTVFLTREEAENALRGGADHE